MGIDIQASLEATARQNAEGCVKTWEDLARYTRVMNDVMPTYIVECGTFSGKSALWFASHACRPYVITIDVDPIPDVDVLNAIIDSSRIRPLTGSSVSSRIVEYVHLRLEDERVGPVAPTIVVLDSDHSGPHVLAEMHAYADLVTPGSYMVVEDTLLRWMPAEERKHYTGDPLDAVQEWMATHGDEWELDVEVESMFPVSQFPGGWLRRKA